MEYNKKLAKFSRNKGISNIEISKKIDYTPLMIGRYLNEQRINVDFIKAVTDAYPEIDWNYIFKDEIVLDGVEETEIVYLKTPEILLKEIEKNVKELLKWHESDTLKK